jgi:hypothetical protein
MPARFPSSAIDVFQLPRWPIASFRVSSAAAGAAAAATSRAAANATLIALRLAMQQFSFWLAVSDEERLQQRGRSFVGIGVH